MRATWSIEHVWNRNTLPLFSRDAAGTAVSRRRIFLMRIANFCLLVTMTILAPVLSSRADEPVSQASKGMSALREDPRRIRRPGVSERRAQGDERRAGGQAARSRCRTAGRPSPRSSPRAPTRTFANAPRPSRSSSATRALAALRQTLVDPKAELRRPPEGDGDVAERQGHRAAAGAGAARQRPEAARPRDPRRSPPTTTRTPPP